MRLSEAERQRCWENVAQQPGKRQEAPRARILLRVDADGPNWPGCRVAEACDCRVRTVENVRKRRVLECF